MWGVSGYGYVRWPTQGVFQRGGEAGGGVLKLCYATGFLRGCAMSADVTKYDVCTIYGTREMATA